MLGLQSTPWRTTRTSVGAPKTTYRSNGRKNTEWKGSSVLRANGIFGVLGLFVDLVSVLEEETADDSDRGC